MALKSPISIQGIIGSRIYPSPVGAFRRVVAAIDQGHQPSPAVSPLPEEVYVFGHPFFSLGN